MRLINLKLKNIRSYEDFEISFPKGSLLLSGDVGSGKTTILLAIEYALFGLQPGQRGSALLRNASDSGEVTLELELDDQFITIERKLKREGKSVTNDYAALTVDGEKVEYSVTELKSRIISLLAYPQEFVKRNNLLYKYTVYTPQEQMKQIILEDTETRLNVLRHIFGIDKYKKIRENLTVFLNRLKEESKILQGEVKTIDNDKSRLGSLNLEIKELEVQIVTKTYIFEENKAKRKSLELEFKDLENSLEEKRRFEKEIEKTNILLASKKENLLSATTEEQEIISSIKDFKFIFNQTEYDKIKKDLTGKKLLLESLNNNYIEILSKISTASSSKRENEAKKERIFKIDMCETCLQDVSDTHKHNIINETDSKLVELKKLILHLESEKERLYKQINLVKTEISSLEQNKLDCEILKSKTEYIDKSRKKVEEIRKVKESLDKDTSLLIKHIAGLKEQILKFSKFNNLLKINQEALRRAFLEEKNSEIILAEIKKEIELTQKEILRLKSSISDKEGIRGKLIEIADISDWLSTHFVNLINFTEINIMMKLRREFSKLFSKWFHTIAGESFFVQLDENFTPLIMQGEIEMDYQFLSGGERTAVALAYRLALNQTINSVLSNIKTRDMVILDEPTDGFSEAQIDKIRDVLEELNVAQLIIVSHEQKIESFVDNIIRLKKSADTSGMESQALSVKTQ